MDITENALRAAGQAQVCGAQGQAVISPEQAQSSRNERIMLT